METNFEKTLKACQTTSSRENETRWLAMWWKLAGRSNMLRWRYEAWTVKSAPSSSKRLHRPRFQQHANTWHTHGAPCGDNTTRKTNASMCAPHALLITVLSNKSGWWTHKYYNSWLHMTATCWSNNQLYDIIHACDMEYLHTTPRIRDLTINGEALRRRTPYSSNHVGILAACECGSGKRQQIHRRCPYVSDARGIKSHVTLVLYMRWIRCWT